jgi:uncharacterized RDD family membrane protein YckC
MFDRMSPAPSPDWALPDPVTDPQFYEGVAVKRLIAWLFDTVLVFLASTVIVVFTLFLTLPLFPLIFVLTAFAYRTLTIASRSATWGMRLMAIELRNFRGHRFSSAEAAGHTALFMLASGFFLPQLISVVMMLVGPRAQGLHDLVMGSAAINRPR